ncbi:LptF/LptG family permease [Candidatus Hepatobacter penaei]|uniref:LptF/LptG family permease n=1 Tax=Candidatus Hepatobacter penaei TaxID=1274402 RepID=UPI0004F2EA02|nr:LptF/LptG family permease [Candidatus Hepatobacter penaei]
MPTFSRYAFRLFLTYFLITFLAVWCLILCAEFIELQRRALLDSSLQAFFLAFLKAPLTIHQLFPLLILASALIVFSRVTQSNEFLALSSTGTSPWKSLAPFFACSLFLGVLNVALLQPLSITTLRHYHLIDIGRDVDNKNAFQMFSSGVWIKQETSEGYVLAHMKKIKNSSRAFHHAFIHVLSPQSKLKASFYANKIGLLNQAIVMKHGWMYDPQNKQQTFFEKKILPYRIDLEGLFLQNFKPDLLYFWSLPRLIALAHEARIPSHVYELKWQELWASIFECLGLTMFAAAIGLQLHQRYGSIILFLTGCFIGFGFYFSTQMTRAFCLAGVISPMIASWATVFFIILTSLVLIVFLEEGHKRNY